MRRFATIWLPAAFAALGVGACGGDTDEGVALAADAPRAASNPFEVETPREGVAALEQLEPAGTAAVAQDARAAIGDEVDASRRTAIVRAANRVAAGVATISVISSRTVQSRSIFDFMRPQTRRAASYGSGFVIDGDEGILLTNEHVVRGAERVQVTLPDGSDYAAEVVGADALTDVAVLRVEADTPLPEVPLGTSEGLYIGEWVVAIGNPFGNLIANSEPSVTTGVVSATGRHIIPNGGDQSLQLGMIQTDAAINPGNSGGPLVNVLGQVIGVNTAIFSRSGGSEGLGFAIPVDRALRVAEDLLEFGEVRRAWLGLDVEPADADIFGRTRGIIVSRVVGGSPAAEAGLVAGRRILSVDGTAVFVPLDWENATLDVRPGDELVVQVEGQDLPIRIRGGTLPSMSAERVEALEDLEMITVTPAIRSERDIRSEAGALVTGISPELSQGLGLREGDVLTGLATARIGVVTITSAEQAAELLREVRRDDRGRRIQLRYERNGGITTTSFAWR
jgi:serine protease Do